MGSTSTVACAGLADVGGAGGKSAQLARLGSQVDEVVLEIGVAMTVHRSVAAAVAIFLSRARVSAKADT